MMVIIMIESMSLLFHRNDVSPAIVLLMLLVSN